MIRHETRRRLVETFEKSEPRLQTYARTRVVIEVYNELQNGSDVMKLAAHQTAKVESHYCVYVCACMYV